jgi:EAL domain-containing protein (putative c-di-GMP-specific phosphodiesterase class I)
MPWSRRERLPANVVLELSELAPVRSYGRLRRVVEQWRERGVRLAIDDVGAGHANMQHVLELSPDVIKLDRALIQDVAVRPDEQALIRGIVKFIRDTGGALVAEGVEDRICAETLVDLGVEWAQGWHFGRPRDLVVTRDPATRGHTAGLPSPAG